MPDSPCESAASGRTPSIAAAIAFATPATLRADRLSITTTSPRWCAERGVKGKYSVVPNPACVGWLDRTLPGWSAKALADSLSLVRELMLPNWDLHPEMLTHTRMIDLKTGRPRPLTGPADMENWYPGRGADVSTDELTAYLAAALRVLKNCGLPCAGVTTPGGFGNGVEDRLAVAVREAVGDVFGTENERDSDGLVRHFFKYVRLGEDPVAAEVRDVRGLDTGRPECVVTVPAATGDWFGGWTGDDPLRDALYCNVDADAGRMVELIERGDPAVMLCHWPGLYNHGAETGFAAFRRIVTALDARFGERTVWMKLSEIARYAAAKNSTTIARQAAGGVRWSVDRGTLYVPSPVLVDDRLYFTQSNRGILTCLDADTGGTIIDRTRLAGLSNVYASPAAADGRVYVTGRDGRTVVLEYGAAMNVLASNAIDGRVDASPALAGDALFRRSHAALYCLARPADLSKNR
ncbi:PQQ-binding-like beta-propeller repeat protein [Alienimonas chondri]|uniref:Pyrrolo-quinoline quinone n=1 Tax=Alienimonas chondri TaxID=2681879 RepID=A0ABX1VA05_9PLAN|nr:PQQ-binding-like beta-propeller repeat protein [Alienimonas chondri]NNJ24884.1 hypothetical protein [Alienimonas chondri]